MYYVWSCFVILSCTLLLIFRPLFIFVFKIHRIFIMLQLCMVSMAKLTNEAKRQSSLKNRKRAIFRRKGVRCRGPFAPQSTYRRRGEMGGGGGVLGCICPLSWSVHYNLARDGRKKERGRVCTPTLNMLGWFYDGTYARKWPLPLCEYSVVYPLPPTPFPTVSRYLLTTFPFDSSSYFSVAASHHLDLDPDWSK